MSLSARRLGAVVCKSLAIVEVDTSRRSAISRCVRPSPRRLRTWAARSLGAKRPLRGRLATARRISLARRVLPPAPSITTPRIRSLPRIAHRSRTQSGGRWSFSAPQHGSLAFSSTVSSPSVRGRAGDQPEIERSSASRSSHKPDTSGPSSFPRPTRPPAPAAANTRKREGGPATLAWTPLRR